MDPERRRANRTTPEDLSYFQFEPVGGGIVLNASEEGLAFHAAAPVRQSGAIRLCVSPNPADRIELVAEIVWMDDTKKSGGMRLEEVSAGTRDQIRQWLSPSIESKRQKMYFPLPSLGIDQLPAISPVPREEVRDLVPRPASPDISSHYAAVSTRSLPRILDDPKSFLFTGRSWDGHNSFFRRRWLGITIGFLVSIFGVLPIVLRPSFRYEFGKALIRLGEKFEGSGDGRAVPPTPRLDEVSPPNSQETSTPPPVDLRKPAVQAPSPDPTVAQAEPKTAIREPNLDERQTSEQPRPAVHSKLRRSARVQQLWSDVAAGDTNAEIALAKLYFKGEGVPRNCEQAWVLLRAASKKGNTEALREYRELNLAGCR
jgi:PilZ domain